MLLSNILDLVIATSMWYFGSMNGAAYAKWNKGIQHRLAESVNILESMKGIRMIGLDNVVVNYMHALREREILVSKPARVLKMALGLLYTLFDWSTYIVTLLAGIYWTTWRDGLDPVTVWPAIAYMRLVAGPFVSLFSVYPKLTAIAARFQRIQDFLNLPEPEDKREIMAVSPDTTAGSGKDGSPTRSSAIRFRGVYVDARDHSHPVLEGVELEVAIATLSMVVGSVGSGKTVLLKTILGEAQASRGLVQLNSAKIAFCDQTTWLPDVSIRNAIIGESPIDEDRYAEAIAACSLDHDIEQLSQGDGTMVGSNGSNMSGGQKQRIVSQLYPHQIAPLGLCLSLTSSVNRRWPEPSIPSRPLSSATMFSALSMLRLPGLSSPTSSARPVSSRSKGERLCWPLTLVCSFDVSSFVYYGANKRRSPMAPICRPGHCHQRGQD